MLLGWTVTRCRPLLRTLHIASLIYAIVIELVPWPPCPLTVAETWLEARAGIEPAHGPFLVHVLDAIVYPDLPEWLVVGCAVLVCVANPISVSAALSSPDRVRSVVTETCPLPGAAACKVNSGGSHEGEGGCGPDSALARGMRYQ